MNDQSNMRMRMRRLVACAMLIGASMGAALAEESSESAIDIYRIGVMAGEYNTQGANLNADWAVGSRTRLALGGGYAHAESDTDSLNVRQAHAGVEQRFDGLALTLESDYRNDNGAIETMLLRLRGDYRGEVGSVGVGVARRRIDVVFDVGSQFRQQVDPEQHTYSTEYGLRLRAAPSAFGVYLSGSYYHYGEDIDRLAARIESSPRVNAGLLPRLREFLDENRARFERLTFLSQRLAGHLLEYSASVGVDYRAGDHLLNVEYTREKETLTDSVIDNYALGWIIPAGAALDVELSAGVSQFEGEDSAVYGSLALTYYR
jgi:hypothetical protein